MRIHQADHFLLESLIWNDGERRIIRIVGDELASLISRFLKTGKEVNIFVSLFYLHDAGSALSGEIFFLYQSLT